MEDNEKIQEILITMAEIKIQLERIISDIESEKDTRKRRNSGFDKRLRDIEEWKNNLQGKLMAGVILGGMIWSIISALIILAITKK